MIWRAISGALLRMRAAWWWMVYQGYRHSYNVDSAFRFNGAAIQLYGGGRIVLAADSYIGELSTVQAAAGLSVTVGRHCMISHNVRIYTSSSVADVDFRVGPVLTTSGSVVIGDGVWIGANCYIAPGVIVGANAVVGANSVVTRAIPPSEIWGGVPARFIRRKNTVAQP